MQRIGLTRSGSRTSPFLSKPPAARRNIRENLIFAFPYNAIGVPIAAGVLYKAGRIDLMVWKDNQSPGRLGVVSLGEPSRALADIDGVLVTRLD